MLYCSEQCQASHWKASHKFVCKELKDERECGHARAKEEGRPGKNRQFLIDWYNANLGLMIEVEILAWKHRSKEERHIICVRTFAHALPSGAPSGTPQVTAMPLSQWVKDLNERDISDHSKHHLDMLSGGFTVSLEVDHAGTETWPRPFTMNQTFRHPPAKMDKALLALLLQDCRGASTFTEKVAAESAFEDHKHAHPETTAQLDVNSSLRVALCHRLQHDTRGCLRGLRSASHLNDTLGLFVSEDPNNPTRSLILLSGGQVRSVPKASFEALRPDTGCVVLHGLTGAAHLNGKCGTLLGLKRGSLERVTVRLVDGEQEVAVKFANYRYIV
jgi:hypothetical protein